MDRLYPTSLAEVSFWQQANGTSATEARLRFVQYVVLEAIAKSNFAASLAFKGGNALRFIYHNQRSTVDLDFSALADFPDNQETLRNMLTQTIGPTAQEFGIRVRCQSVVRNPKSIEHTLATYQTKLGYAFPGDRYFVSFENDPKPIPTIVELEISLNEMVCETVPHALTNTSNQFLNVCSLEDIIAEKLRSLLQQPLRNRHRKQDVLDIATVWTLHHSRFNMFHIADYLLRKAKARNVSVSKVAFNEDIRNRAMVDYDQMRRDAGESFIEFTKAWDIVLNLVQQLDIPDTHM